MKTGDKIKWQYTHHFNGKSRAERVKNGVFKRLIKHTVKHKGKQLSVVQFDGNREQSRVPLAELYVVLK